jgi:hypothetical protein
MVTIRRVSGWILAGAIAAGSITCSSDIGDPDARPASLVKIAGDEQGGMADRPLPASLVVRVADEDGRPLEGVTVAWSIGGGGSLDRSEVPTGPDGTAAVQRVLGSAPGVVTTTAAVADLPAVVFTSTVESEPQPNLILATPPSTTAVNGQPFGNQPVIQVDDGTEQPAGAGIEVTASVTGATLTGTTAVESDGEGVVRFTDLALSGEDGTYTITFSSPGYVPVLSPPITLSSTPTTNGRLVMATEPSSSAESGEVLAQQPSVRAEDDAGAPLADVPVTVSVEGATLSGTITVETGGDGIARFTDLALSGPSGSYPLVFSAPDLVGLESSPVTLQTIATESGQWTAPMEWPIVAIHTMLLPDGRVLAINRTRNPQVWDPATGIFKSVPAPANLFCAGHALLPDGTVFLAGGHIDDNQGLPNVTLFSPTADSWTSLPPMARGRWYPTTTVMGNGDVVIIAGRDENMLEVTIPEVWSNGTIRQLTGASQTLPYYPRAFVAPDGRLYVAGSAINTRYLSLDGTGSWQAGPRRLGEGRPYGSAVMYDDGKILYAGGGQTTNTAELIDLNEGSPQWRWTSPMAHARRHLNLTVLPNGEVLATGGVGGTTFNDVTAGVHAAEMWNPGTSQWRTLASNQITRGYHSSSLLLPDGRVLHAGSGEGAGAPDQKNAELFSPPYLLRGPRPEITSAPAEVAYGAQFRLLTPQAGEVTKVSLIRLGATTHAFDENQRFQWLTFTVEADGVTVTAPSSRNRAPPGHYMVFILNGDDVPSVGKIVRIH